MNTTTWTKFSDRLPEESIKEVFALDNGQVKVWQQNNGWLFYERTDVYWHPITYPELPRELDQAEKDMNAMERAMVEVGPVTGVNKWGWFAEGFERGIKYERAEIAKLLNTGEGNPWMRSKIPSIDALNQMRKREGIDK
jgi:hypothetical protein